MLDNFDFASLCYVVGTLIYVSFVTIYFFAHTWWETPIGRMMLFTGIATVGIGITASLYAFLGPDYAFRDLARHIGAGIFVLSGAVFMLTFLEQRVKTPDQIIASFSRRPQRTILEVLMRKPKYPDYDDAGQREREDA